MYRFTKTHAHPTTYCGTKRTLWKTKAKFIHLDFYCPFLLFLQSNFCRNKNISINVYLYIFFFLQFIPTNICCNFIIFNFSGTVPTIPDDAMPVKNEAKNKYKRNIICSIFILRASSYSCIANSFGFGNVAWLLKIYINVFLLVFILMFKVM